jgi:hypothetical protein
MGEWAKLSAVRAVSQWTRLWHRCAESASPKRPSLLKKGRSW